MIKCNCRTKDGIKEETAYNINEFKQMAADRGGFMTLDSYGEYIKIPATFDIESSTYKDDRRTLSEGRDIYRAFMYQWQMCIEGIVVFGNTWPEWLQMLEVLKRVYLLQEKRKLVIYVHNLSYEFVFLYSFVTVNSTFATDRHKVLKAVINDCFELRCSYYLSNMSLEKFIENSPGTVHIKAGGDLDYRRLKLPTDPLTPVEYGYCYNDVAGLYERILSRLENDTIKTIPLTSTGYVRRDCRTAMNKNKENRKQFLKSKLNKKQYRLLKDVFRGGNTAGNRYATGFIIDNVNSYDISSSYPFVMLSEKMPAGKFLYSTIESREELEYYNSKYCTIGYYVFDNIRLKENIAIPYLPTAKCIKLREPLRFNGRILKRQTVVIGLTNIDFEIIDNQYEYDGLYVYDFYFARSDYLPSELRGQILKYFNDKSKLRGVKGKEYEYNKAKNRLNAIYGMTVTDILHEEYEFNNGEFTPKSIDKTLDDYYKSRNSFLSYQWGCFVTRYRRKNLQMALDRISAERDGTRANDIIYVDTDSVKYLGDYDYIFNDINNEILKRCADNDIIHSISIDGKTYTLGLFDKEQGYQRFITLGAKKYAYEQNGKIGVTVSGLNKKQGAEELTKKGGLNRFTIGETFFNSGRTVAYYNNEPVHTITINGVDILTASNIGIVDTTYTLGITDTMRSILISLGVM